MAPTLAPVLAQHLQQLFHPAGFPPSAPRPQPRHLTPTCRETLSIWGQVRDRGRSYGDQPSVPEGCTGKGQVSALEWLGLLSCA